jgi:hypothetical protein
MLFKIRMIPNFMPMLFYLNHSELVNERLSFRVAQLNFNSLLSYIFICYFTAG